MRLPSRRKAPRNHAKNRGAKGSALRYAGGNKKNQRQGRASRRTSLTVDERNQEREIQNH